MRIAILGIGALGCVYGARLAGQAEVWMLGTWVEGITAIQQDGIHITDPDGHAWQARVRATSDPAVVPPADCALVLVKSYQTDRAAAWAAQVLKPHGLTVTLQNGLDNGPKLIAAVGADRVARGVTYNGATLLGPGHARHAARQPTCIGENPITAERVAALVALLDQAGLEAHTTPDVESLLWGKAVANAAINPLTALWRAPNGEVCATAARRALLADLAQEAAAVAVARGITLPFEDPVAYAESVCQRTAANRSSMLQDIERGRPTEIDSITGVIVAEGRRLGVPTPVSEVVWRLVNCISRNTYDAPRTTHHREASLWNAPRTIAKHPFGTHHATRSHPAMQVVETIADVRRIRRAGAGSWGLAPTMGFLHAGHISLVERARRENDHVAASIFVNPTQFAPTEDLAAYPRDLPRDLALLEAAGADLVWAPPVEEVYPPSFQTYVTVEEVTRVLEGAARPTHFRGVATVVAKLFNVFQPDRAYFGQKDAQQAVVIQQMARDLAFPLEVVICPIVREPDGLAMSSRNIYLTPEQRAAAPVLYRALCAARDAWQAGEHDGERLRQIMRDVLAAEPLARPDYVSAADPVTLAELGDASRGVLLSMAVRVGKARLIDNMLLMGSII